MEKYQDQEEYKEMNLARDKKRGILCQCKQNEKKIELFRVCLYTHRFLTSEDPTLAVCTIKKNRGSL